MLRVNLCHTIIFFFSLPFPDHFRSTFRTPFRKLVNEPKSRRFEASPIPPPPRHNSFRVRTSSGLLLRRCNKTVKCNGHMCTRIITYEMVSHTRFNVMKYSWIALKAKAEYCKEQYFTPHLTESLACCAITCCNNMPVMRSKDVCDQIYKR